MTRALPNFVHQKQYRIYCLPHREFTRVFLFIKKIRLCHLYPVQTLSLVSSVDSVTCVLFRLNAFCVSRKKKVELLTFLQSENFSFVVSVLSPPSVLRHWVSLQSTAITSALLLKSVPLQIQPTNSWNLNSMMNTILVPLFVCLFAQHFPLLHPGVAFVTECGQFVHPTFIFWRPTFVLRNAFFTPNTKINMLNKESFTEEKAKSTKPKSVTQDQK